MTRLDFQQRRQMLLGFLVVAGQRGQLVQPETGIRLPRIETHRRLEQRTNMLHVGRGLPAGLRQSVVAGQIDQ